MKKQKRWKQGKDIDHHIYLNIKIKNNHDVIESINFQGITNEIQLAILRGICEKNQLQKYSFNLPGDTDYKKVEAISKEIIKRKRNILTLKRSILNRLIFLI